MSREIQSHSLARSTSRSLTHDRLDTNIAASAVRAHHITYRRPCRRKTAIPLPAATSTSSSPLRASRCLHRSHRRTAPAPPPRSRPSTDSSAFSAFTAPDDYLVPAIGRHFHSRRQNLKLFLHNSRSSASESGSKPRYDTTTTEAR